MTARPKAKLDTVPSQLKRGPIKSPNCGDCPFSKDGRPHKPVAGEGPSDPDFILVGEGPGRMELIQGRPFVGKSGKLVNQVLLQLGVPRERVWMANTALCLTGDTQVRMADGSLRRIGEIVKYRTREDVLSVAEDGRLVSRPIVGWYRNPRTDRALFRLTFTNARTNHNGKSRAKLTEDHPVLTPDGWLPVRDAAGGLIATGIAQLTEASLDVFVGTALGDGCLTASLFQQGHCDAQREWIELKISAMRDLGFSERERDRRNFVRYASASSRWIRVQRELFRPNGRRVIPKGLVEASSDLMFATWYLDDGCLQMRTREKRSPRMQICATSYSEDELQFVRSVLARRGYEATIAKGRIHFTVAGTRAFSRAIRAFVPPTMEYKLLPEDRGCFNASHFIPSSTVWFDRAEVTAIEPRRQDQLVYCIDVEGTHNFVTPGGVVHNCDPKNKRGIEKANECCKPRLEQELAMFPGIPIGTLGAHAARTVLPDRADFKITELSGSLHDVDVDGTGERPIITAIHPAAILRGGSGTNKKDRSIELAIWNFTYDLAKVVGLARGDKVRFSEDVETSVGDPDRTWDLLCKLVERAYEEGVVAIDLETTGPHPLLDDITTVGIATPTWGFAADYESFDDESWALFAKLCADRDVAKTFHNRQFDEQLLIGHGIVLDGPRHDTMLKHHAVFPGAVHKLQRVIAQFWARTPWKSDFRHGDGSMEEETEYCAKDTLGTARLDVLMETYLERTGTRGVYAIDNRMAQIAMRMTRVGVPIDKERNAELADQFITVIERTRSEIEGCVEGDVKTKWIEHLAFQMAQKKRKSDPPDFEARHAVRVRELTHGVRGKKGFILKGKEPVEFSISNVDHQIALIQALGYKLHKKTATGKFSGDKEVLESLAHIPEVRTIMDFKEAAYSYSHFVKTTTSRDEKGLLIDTDWRNHPDWEVMKITGRWGSSPNWQNVPLKKTDKDTNGNLIIIRPNLRSQVRARPGKRLIGADFAQLEARIIAMMSGDPFLSAIFLGARDCDDCEAAPPGKYCPAHDVHTVFACEVWPDFLERPKQTQKELRDLVKRGEYGGFYGGAIQTLFNSIVKEFPEVTMAQVAKIVQIIANKMPEVGRWHQEMMKTAIQQKEIKSAILGRRRCFPLGNADPTVVRNFPVQSTAADIMNLGLKRLTDELTARGYYDVESWEFCKAEPILQVHDSIVLEVDEDIADEVGQIVTEMLTQTHTYNGNEMVFPAEASVGTVWGEDA